MAYPLSISRCVPERRLFGSEQARRGPATLLQSMLTIDKPIQFLPNFAVVSTLRTRTRRRRWTCRGTRKFRERDSLRALEHQVRCFLQHSPVLSVEDAQKIEAAAAINEAPRSKWQRRTCVTRSSTVSNDTDEDCLATIIDRWIVNAALDAKSDEEDDERFACIEREDATIEQTQCEDLDEVQSEAATCTPSEFETTSRTTHLKHTYSGILQDNENNKRLSGFTCILYM